MRSHRCMIGVPRRGITTIWIILAGCALLMTLVIVTDVGNLWLARVDLENGLEAAALAGAKEWGEQGGGDTLIPRQVAQQYAASNTVVGTPLQIDLNYDPDNDGPNQNLSCDGDLVFGAVRGERAPFEFHAGEPGGCAGFVFIDATKCDSGADVDPRIFGIFFDEGAPNISIRSVTFTAPDFDVNNIKQQPHFDGTKAIVVSIENDEPDFLNRFNPTGLDYRGLDPDPRIFGTNIFDDNWRAFPSDVLDPNNQDPAINPADSNPNGDIVFALYDEISPGLFKSLTIYFKDGTFTSTNDPDTTDFVRFGASINQFNPPAIHQAQNNGDSFGIAGVLVTVTFFDNLTNTLRTARGVFVDVPMDCRSEAFISGFGDGLGVRAQKTVSVESLWKRICGCPIGPFNVSATTTAFYDCSSGCTRLIRIEKDKFFCP